MVGARLASAVLVFSSLGACGGALDAERSDLEGSWAGPCFPTSATQSAQTRIVYNDLQLTGTYHEFSDSACAVERHTSTWTGQASGGEELTAGVRKLDLAFASFRSKPLTAAEADFVNQGQYCGITDWAANVERDILGKACYNFTIPVGGKSLDIYSRTGTMLRFGKGSKILASPTEADRPTELDPMVAYNRQ